jgi:streptogramin lyase
MLEQMVARSFVSALLLALLLSAPAQAVCPADCDGGETVTISELITAVRIALGAVAVATCPAADTNDSGSVSISELIAAVNAALSGCPGVGTETPTSPPTPTPSITPIFPANYRSSFVEVRDCRFSIEHDSVAIRVLVNEIGADAYLNNANPLPVGSIVIKEEYDAPDCSNDADLARWRVMRKEAPGFDPEDNDWAWQWVDAPNRSVRFNDKSTCVGCHQREECLARDYMCTEDTSPRGTVRAKLQDLDGALLSISGTSPTDVYAVGADPEDGSGPLIVHYDGEVFTRLESGAGGDLWWITTPPIEGDFYMAGAGGLILQYDPPSGAFTRHTTPGNELLYGIWGSAANDIWAVGGDESQPETGGVIWRYDGEMWSVQDLSSVRPAGVPVLFKVWGRHAGEVYAVGRRGIILRFNGSTWSEVDNPMSTPRDLFTVHGNATTVAACGGQFTGSLLETVAGVFTDATPSAAPQLNGIFLPPDGSGVAVGRESTVAVREQSGWVLRDPALPDALLDFHAVWVDSEDGIWTVGGDLSTDLDQGVLAYDGPQSIPTGVLASCGKQQGTICSVAGTGRAQFDGDGRQALLTSLYLPIDVDFDRNGQLLILDWNNLRLRRVNANGTMATVMGRDFEDFPTDGALAVDTPLHHTSDMEFDGSGTLYLAGDHVPVVFRVVRVGPDDRVFTVAGSEDFGNDGDGGPALDAKLSVPFGVLPDDKGGFYISDVDANVVRYVDAAGIITTVAGTGQPGYSGDDGPGTAARLSGPARLKFGPDGNLYFCETRNHVIRRLHPNGTIDTFAGTGEQRGYAGDEGPARQAKLDTPYDIQFAPNGDAYVADTGNNVIRRIDTSGIVTTAVGDGRPIFAGDGGAAADCSLRRPSALRFDAEGSMWIADTSNHRVRRVWRFLTP